MPSDNFTAQALIGEAKFAALVYLFAACAGSVVAFTSQKLGMPVLTIAVSPSVEPHERRITPVAPKPVQPDWFHNPPGRPVPGAPDVRLLIEEMQTHLDNTGRALQRAESPSGATPPGMSRLPESVEIETVLGEQIKATAPNGPLLSTLNEVKARASRLRQRFVSSHNQMGVEHTEELLKKLTEIENALRSLHQEAGALALDPLWYREALRPSPTFSPNYWRLKQQRYRQLLKSQLVDLAGLTASLGTL